MNKQTDSPAADASNSTASGRRRHVGIAAATTLALSLVAVILLSASQPQALHAADHGKAKQEFYELRIYRIANPAKKEMVSGYLRDALLPALKRQGIDRVGVFTVIPGMDKTKVKRPGVAGKMAIDHSIYVLIPYPSLDKLAGLSDALAPDAAYQKAAEPIFSRPTKDPAYTRIESKLMKAFKGMPVLELPDYSKQKKPRLFELRTYESHTTEAAYRKVDMFNNGEIQIMRDVKLGPVFFGEMLVGGDVPNLTYLLSAENMEAHQAHWKGFIAHPEWDRMKKMKKYAGTVSKITKWFLAPTDYSGI